MLKELNEIIDYIENSKFAKELNDILQKYKQLEVYVLNNDYDNALAFSLHINRTTDYEGLVEIRNNMYLVSVNPYNNPNEITPKQHIYRTLEALAKLLLKKIFDHIKEDIKEKSITINWNDQSKFIFKTIKSLIEQN